MLAEIAFVARAPVAGVRQHSVGWSGQGRCSERQLGNSNYMSRARFSDCCGTVVL
jgi:hypothetical protein